MQAAVEQLKKLLSIEDKDISVPPNPEMGDLSTNIAFKLSKEKKENPNITAINLMSTIDLSKTIFLKAKAFGPYINFFIDYEKLAKKTIKEALIKNYGLLKKSNKNVLIEFPNPNTNKPFHLGHLLQILLGTSLSRIIESQGFNVKRLNVYNDRGIHICQSMVAYKKWGKGKKPNKKPDHFVGDYYVMFNSKKNEGLIKEAEQMLIDWENGDKKVMALWKKMNAWAYKGFNETFAKIGIDKYDKIYHESDFYANGKDIVLNGHKQGVFKKEDDGAIYCEMNDGSKKYLLRKNSTSLYITQDLALAKLKEKDFSFEQSIYMTSNEQNHYFGQLFEILEKLGLKSAEKLKHIGTGYISLPSGKMKSREGKIVDVDNLIDEINILALKEVKKRKSKISKKEIEKIALSAIKYHILKTTSSKDTVFNPEESISFEGNTGPYILYSIVRAKKIITKSSKKSIDFDAKTFESFEEKELIKSLFSFPDAVKKSYEAMSPHILCSQAYSMAKAFNSFYEKCPILNAENAKQKSARLLLSKAFVNVMEKSMHLLGIETVKEM
ncbi:MAG: arginine--tRNA ligase [Candidatus Nanoarchaeia archaeon]|nr:arginine--tRNA ligase [Candidatus Nanoarchaeia archaeon]MDD5499621.1 arginine--tRNA ligase [Candidatus Nanoarchaeia archaeon]